LFGYVDVQTYNFLNCLLLEQLTPGHRYASYSKDFTVSRFDFHSFVNVNVCNALPTDAVNFTTLSSFESSVSGVDLSNYCIYQVIFLFYVLARDAFLNESSRYRHDVRPSVCLSGTGVHCDHTVHVIADLCLRLDSPMFWAP